MKNKLILFDIDGVLVKEGSGIGRFSFALWRVFGIEVNTKGIKTSGKTDTQILIELAKSVGISEALVRRRIQALYIEASRYMKTFIRNQRIITQPGVRRFLSMLKTERYLVGLVTGNLHSIAKMKIKRIGIERFFECGGFGDSFLPRSDLIRKAITQARNKFKVRLTKSDIFYFGDSPLDVLAGKEAGVVTIAVATGRYTQEELRRTKPDFVIENLRKPREIIKIIQT